MLYVHNHLLVLHFENYILTFAVGPDGQLAKHSEVNSSRVSKVQNSQLVVDKENGAVYMVCSGKCLSFQWRRVLQ